jgi:hypothetical protein
VIHALAGGARGREQNFGFSPCLLVKEHCVGVEKANIVKPQPSVEQSTVETLNIDMCLTSRLCEGQKRWRNQVFCGHFKTFENCGFSASAKKHRSPRTLILMH